MRFIVTPPSGLHPSKRDDRPGKPLPSAINVIHRHDYPIPPRASVDARRGALAGQCVGKTRPQRSPHALISPN